MGLSFKGDEIILTPYYTLKDFMGVITILVLYLGFVFYMPNYLGHSDNFIKANPMVTPAHIVPEWYFLPFYAILRAVPDKLSGVLLLVGIIICIILLPYYYKPILGSILSDDIIKIIK
jgi:ubiquinol-cytochrome c reductase cytochrome b subunit